MTNVIELAKQAGLFTHREVQPEITRFAKLVRDAALEEACGNRCNAEYNPCYARAALTAANAVHPQAQGSVAVTVVNALLAAAPLLAKAGHQQESVECNKALLFFTGAAMPAHPQATEPAWRPIESAPKDGTLILLFGDGRVTSGHWSAPSEIPRIVYQDGFAPEPEWDEWDPHWASWDGGFTEEHPATHWMPLPAAPEAHHGK